MEVYTDFLSRHTFHYNLEAPQTCTQDSFLRARKGVCTQAGDHGVCTQGVCSRGGDHSCREAQVLLRETPASGERVPTGTRQDKGTQMRALGGRGRGCARPATPTDAG